MTKKEICLSNLSFAYYSGFGGLEVKFIEDGIKHYHKLKIHGSYDGAYIRLHGYRCFLHDFIRIGG